jgi:serine/threonine protein phosphatase 1
MPARTIAIGDIHGCDVALAALIEMLQPAVDDTVVILGDVVDRGPGSRQSIEQLIELQRRCRLVLIMGNHDEMMIAAIRRGHALDAWLRFGGQETVECYGGEAMRVPVAHVEFLEAGRHFWETDTEIFVHGSLEPGVLLEQQSPEWMRWTHLTGAEEPHPSGRRVICGHTSLRGGVPGVLPGWVCIDTCAFGGQPLTALDVGSDLVYQADQQGRTWNPVPLPVIAADLPALLEHPPMRTAERRRHVSGLSWPWGDRGGSRHRDPEPVAMWLPTR